MTREELNAIKDHTRAIEQFILAIGRKSKAKGKSKKAQYALQIKRIRSGIQKA